MEENSNVKRKNEPSVPPNYVSILQLQERWLKEKERKQKEKEEEYERRREQQIEEQRRREGDPEKIKAEKQLKEVGDGKGFYRKGPRLSGRNSRRKERVDGGEAIPVDAEGPVAAAIVSENGEAAAAAGDEKLPEIWREKKKRDKKKKTKALIEGDVAGCEPNAPPANSGTEDTAVKKGIQIAYKPKGGNSSRERNKSLCKSAPTDPTDIETRFEVLNVNGGEERGDATNVKPSGRWNHGRDNWRHSRNPKRWSEPREPMKAAMVWVKKGEIPGNGGGGDGQ